MQEKCLLQKKNGEPIKYITKEDENAQLDIKEKLHGQEKYIQYITKEDENAQQLDIEEKLHGQEKDQEDVPGKDQEDRVNTNRNMRSVPVEAHVRFNKNATFYINKQQYKEKRINFDRLK